MVIVNPEVVTGALLKELIKKSNVSITDVADKLDKTRSAFLATLKCSNTKPSEDEVTAILKILGVPRSDFDFQKLLITQGLETEYGIKLQLQGTLIDCAQRRQVREHIQHLYLNKSPRYTPRAFQYRPVC